MPAAKKSLVLGTRNPGKLRELERILGDAGWVLRSLEEFENVGMAEESGDTYSANVIAKARFYAAATGVCALADDSGLEVEALGGAPGIHSARYAGDNSSDADRREALLSALARTSNSNRKSRFVCVIAIADSDGVVLNVSEGVCEGAITIEPRGAGGFGYDPLFIPDGYNETFAELPAEVKNELSHRARALRKTRQFLTTSDFPGGKSCPS
jgi:XTP/dITP diphosphohydrolase